jgi:hypothetical protein
MSVGVTYQFTVPNIADTLTRFNQARIYRASTQSGPFNYLTSVALVAGTSGYAIRDEDGLPTNWYQHEHFHSTTLAVSPRSEPVPGSVEPVSTRRDLRRRTALELELYGHPWTEYSAPGPSGTTTAGGSATTVVCADYAMGDYDALDWRGWSLLLNDGAQAGRERRVTGFDAVTGTFTVAPALSGAPGTGATFDLYGEAPSGWWNDRLNEARLHIWYPFRWPLAGIAGQTEYVLPEFIFAGHQITRLIRQHGGTPGGEMRALGSMPEVVERDGGGLSLYAPHLGVNSVWWLEGRRHPPELLSDAATVVLDDQRAQLFAVTAAQIAAARLGRGFGAAEDRRRWQELAAELEAKRRGLARSLGMFTQQRLARREAMVGVSTGWEV